MKETLRGILIGTEGILVCYLIGAAFSLIVGLLDHSSCLHTHIPGELLFPSHRFGCYLATPINQPYYGESK